MSESPETTATFNKLLNNGLITKSDLIREGFHVAATDVMVGRDNQNVDNDNPITTNRKAKQPRAREVGEQLDERDRTKETAVIEDGFRQANTLGFGKLADELAKLIVSDKNEKVRQDEGPESETGSPTITEGNVLSAMCCGPVFQGLLHPTRDAGHDMLSSPAQIRTTELKAPEVLEREMPESMM